MTNEAPASLGQTSPDTHELALARIYDLLRIQVVASFDPVVARRSTPLAGVARLLIATVSD